MGKQIVGWGLKILGIALAVFLLVWTVRRTDAEGESLQRPGEGVRDPDTGRAHVQLGREAPAVRRQFPSSPRT